MSSTSTWMDQNFSEKLEENLSLFEELFRDDDTVLLRRFRNQYSNRIVCCLLFTEGMINADLINHNVIHPIVNTSAFHEDEQTNEQTLETLMEQVIVSVSIGKTADITILAEAILDGNAVLIVDGLQEALIIGSQEVKTRAIEEPETERVLRGPKEGFTESIITNATMLRRKLRTLDFKMKSMIIGTKTKTRIYICYLRNVANPKIIEELTRRLEAIELDGILDSGYIQELIRDTPFSPFRTIGSTERPDVVAGKLLEGRIALLVDGTPVALTLPYIFVEAFQFNDDYYINYYFSSIGRILRILGFLITISFTPIYIALITFHQEMIPTPLIVNISASREGVPFPTIVEAMGMLIIFETLRETGLRMPTFMGQALSIVGALVIGQAAVEAKFVSAPIVIVIATTGITGLMIPKLTGAVILIRFVLILLTGFLGLYGYIFGLAGLLIHLYEIRSFGVPYMYKLMLLNLKEDIKDTSIRAPWWYMRNRPSLIAINKIRNQTNNHRGKK